MERFYLMNGRDKVLEFGYECAGIDERYEIYKVLDSNQLPLQLRYQVDESTFGDWVRRRIVSKKRKYIKAVLYRLKLRTPFSILRYSHGLSLNDTFWVQSVGADLDFDKINLYDNQFDTSLGWMTLTGIPGDVSQQLLTPELTTPGNMRKCWQRTESDKVVLCKGGSLFYSSSYEYEPFNEVMASILSEKLNCNAVASHLEFVASEPVSISYLFTSKEIGLVSAEKYLTYKSHGESYFSLESTIAYIMEDFGDLRSFYDMCFFDFIIGNGNRHLNNWGYLVHNKTQELIGLAPMWDHGFSLDYENPADCYGDIPFRSFRVRYDFVKSCEYHADYIQKCKMLIHFLDTGELERECHEVFRDFPKYNERIGQVLDFVKNRCEEYITW